MIKTVQLNLRMLDLDGPDYVVRPMGNPTDIYYCIGIKGSGALPLHLTCVISDLGGPGPFPT